MGQSSWRSVEYFFTGRYSADNGNNNIHAIGFGGKIYAYGGDDHITVGSIGATVYTGTGNDTVVGGAAYLNIEDCSGDLSVKGAAGYVDINKSQDGNISFAGAAGGTSISHTGNHGSVQYSGAAFYNKLTQKGLTGDMSFKGAGGYNNLWHETNKGNLFFAGAGGGNKLDRTWFDRYQGSHGDVIFSGAGASNIITSRVETGNITFQGAGASNHIVRSGKIGDIVFQGAGASNHIERTQQSYDTYLETRGDIKFYGVGGYNILSSNVAHGNVYFNGGGVANVIMHSSTFGNTEFNGAGAANVIVKSGEKGDLTFRGAGLANVLVHQSKLGSMDVYAGGAVNVLIRIGDGKYLAHLLAYGNISVHKGNGSSRVIMFGGYNTHTQLGTGNGLWLAAGGYNIMTQKGSGNITSVLIGGANVLTKIGDGNVISGMLGGANIITHISGDEESSDTSIIALGGANILTKKGKGNTFAVMGGGANVLSHVGNGMTTGVMVGGANILTKIGHGDTTGIMLGAGNVLTHVGDGQTIGVMGAIGNVFTKVGDGTSIAAMIGGGNIFTHVGKGDAWALMGGLGNIFTKIGDGNALALMIAKGNVFTHVGNGTSVALMLAKANIATKVGHGMTLSAMVGAGNIFTHIGNGTTFAAMIGKANVMTKVGDDLTAALMIGKANIYTHVGNGTSIGMFAGELNLMTKVGKGTTLAVMFGKANIMTHVGDGLTGVLALGEANIVTKVGDGFMGVVAAAKANVVTHVGDATTAAVLIGKGNILTKVGEGTTVGLLISDIGNVMTHVGGGITIGLTKGKGNIITKVGDGMGINVAWGQANVLTHIGEGDRYNFAKGEANLITKVGNGQEVSVVHGKANIITHIGDGDDYIGAWGDANIITKVGDGRNVVLAKGKANIVTQIGDGDSFNALWSDGNIVTKVGDGIQVTAAKGKANITTTVGDGLSVTAAYGDANINTKVGDGISVNASWGKYNISTKVGNGLNVAVMKGKANINIHVGDGMGINASYAQNNIAIKVGNGDFYSLAVASSNTSSSKLSALFSNIKQTVLGGAGSQAINYLVQGDDASSSGMIKGRGAIKVPEVTKLDGFQLDEVKEVNSNLGNDLTGSVTNVETPDLNKLDSALNVDSPDIANGLDGSQQSNTINQNVAQSGAAKNAIADKEQANAGSQKLEREKNQQLAALSGSQVQLEETDQEALKNNGQKNRKEIEQESNEITEELTGIAKKFDVLNQHKNHEGTSGESWLSHFSSGTTDKAQQQISKAKDDSSKHIKETQKAFTDNQKVVKQSVQKSEEGTIKSNHIHSNVDKDVDDAKLSAKNRETSALSEQHKAKNSENSAYNSVNNAQSQSDNYIKNANHKATQAQINAKNSKQNEGDRPERRGALGSGLSNQISGTSEPLEKMSHINVDEQVLPDGKFSQGLIEEFLSEDEIQAELEDTLTNEELEALSIGKNAVDRLQINSAHRANNKKYPTILISQEGNTNSVSVLTTEPETKIDSSLTQTKVSEPTDTYRNSIRMSGINLEGLGEHKQDLVEARANKVANLYRWLDKDSNLATNEYIPVPKFEHVNVNISDEDKNLIVKFMTGYIENTNNNVPKDQSVSLATLFVESTLEHNWDKRVQFLAKLESYGYNFEPPHKDKSIISFWSGNNFKEYRNVLDTAQTDGKKVAYDIDIKGNSFAIELNKQLMRWGQMFLETDNVEQSKLKNAIKLATSSNTGFWSSVYATGARNDVYVVAEGGIRIGNYFWNVELPVLRQLQREGLVGEIRLLDKPASEYKDKPIDTIGRRLTDDGVNVKIRFDSLSTEQQAQLLANNPKSYEAGTLVDLKVNLGAIDNMLSKSIPFYSLRTERNLLVQNSDSGFEVRDWLSNDGNSKKIINVENPEDVSQIKTIERFILANFDNYAQLPEHLYLIENKVISYQDGRTRILAQKENSEWKYSQKTDLMSVSDLLNLAHVSGKIRGESYQKIVDSLSAYHVKLQDIADYQLESVEMLTHLRNQVEAYLLAHPDSGRRPALKTLLSQVDIRINESSVFSTSESKIKSVDEFSHLYSQIKSIKAKTNQHLYLDNEGNFETKRKEHILRSSKRENGHLVIDKIKSAVSKEYGQEVSDSVFTDLSLTDLAKNGKGIDIAGLNNIHRAIEDHISPVSATMFIWKPSAHSRLGHAALQIGQGRTHVDTNDAEKYNQKNYVSWWPLGIKSSNIQEIFNIATEENPELKIRWKDFSQPAHQSGSLESDVRTEENDNFGLKNGDEKLEIFTKQLEGKKGVNTAFKDITTEAAMFALGNPRILVSTNIPEHIYKPFVEQWNGTKYNMQDVGNRFAEELRKQAQINSNEEVSKERADSVLKNFSDVDLADIDKFKNSEADQGRVFRINLEGLDVSAMQAEWSKISNDPDARYQLLTKNCSTAVAKILKAGGADKLIGHTWRPKFGIWTPTELFDYGQALQKAQLEIIVKKQSRYLNDTQEKLHSSKNKVAMENDGKLPHDSESRSWLTRTLNDRLYGNKQERRNIDSVIQNKLINLVKKGDADKVTLKGESGRLTGYYHYGKQTGLSDSNLEKSKKTVLFLHGSGSSAENQLTDINTHYQKLGIDVLAVNMRGFGSSDGGPSEKGLYQDARTMFNYLVNDKGINPRNIIIHGYSMGAPVAADLARHVSQDGKRISGLLLDRPMPSMTKAIGAREISSSTGITEILSKAVNGQFSVEKNLKGLPKDIPIMLLTDNEKMGNEGEKLRTKLVDSGYRVTGEQTFYAHEASNRLMSEYVDKIVAHLSKSINESIARKVSLNWNSDDHLNETSTLPEQKIQGFSDEDIDKITKKSKEPSIDRKNYESRDLVLEPIKKPESVTLGIPEVDQKILADIAEQDNLIIAIRPIDEKSKSLIASKLYSSKGLFVKAKSSDWGPMSGFIPVDQFFAKESARKELVKFNSYAEQSIESGNAVSVDLHIDQARIDELTLKYKSLTPLELDPQSGLYKTTATNGAQDHSFYLKQVIVDNKSLWQVHYMKDGNLTPFQVIGDPLSKKPITADYDLLTVMHHYQDLGSMDKVKQPLEWSEWKGSVTYEDLTPSQKELYNNEALYNKCDGRSLGVISDRVKKVKDRINASLGRTNGMEMVHHGADDANPYAVIGDNFPATFFVPKIFFTNDGLGHGKGAIQTYFNVNEQGAVVIRNQQELSNFLQVAINVNYRASFNDRWNIGADVPLFTKERKLSHSFKNAQEEIKRRFSSDSRTSIDESIENKQINTIDTLPVSEVLDQVISDLNKSSTIMSEIGFYDPKKFESGSAREKAEWKQILTNINNIRNMYFPHDLARYFEALKTYKVGNCGDRSMYAAHLIMNKYNFDGEVELLKLKGSGDHVFVRIGGTSDSAKIIDPWTGQYFSYSQIDTFLYNPKNKKVEVHRSFDDLKTLFKDIGADTFKGSSKIPELGTVTQKEKLSEIDNKVNNQNIQSWERIIVTPIENGGETRFDGQIIIQLEDDPTVAKATANLAGKHPEKSVVVQLDAEGNYRVVHGDPSLLSGKLRWQLVGHGRNEAESNNMRLSGYNADEIAVRLAKFNQDFSQTKNIAAKPEHISIVGCSLVSDDKRNGFAHNFIAEMNKQGIRSTVSARSTEVAIDEAGRKYTRDTNDQWAHKQADNKVVLSWNEKNEVVTHNENIHNRVAEGDIDLARVGQVGSDTLAKGAIGDNTDVFTAPNKRRVTETSSSDNSSKHLSYSGNIQVNVGDGEFTTVNWGTSNIGVKVGTGGVKSLNFGDNNVMIHMGDGESKHSFNIAGYQALEGAQMFVGTRNISFNMGRSNDLIVMSDKSIPTPPLINPFDSASQISGALQRISDSGKGNSWLTAQEQQWTLAGAKKFVKDMSGIDLTSNVDYTTLTDLDSQNERSSRGLKSDTETTLNKHYNNWLNKKENKNTSNLSRADKLRQNNEKLAFNFAVGGQGSDIQVTAGNWNLMFGDNIQALLDTNLGSLFGLMTQQFSATGQAKTTFTYNPKDFPRQLKNKLLSRLASVSSDTTLGDIFGVDYTASGHIISRNGEAVDGTAILTEMIELIGKFCGEQLKAFTDPSKLLDSLKSGIDMGADGIKSFAESHGLKEKEIEEDKKETSVSVNGINVASTEQETGGDSSSQTTSINNTEQEKAFGFNALNLPNLFATIFSKDKQTEMKSLVENMKENLASDLMNMEKKTFDFLRNSGHLKDDGDVHISLGNYNFNWGGAGKDLGAYLGDNNNFWGGAGDDVYYATGTSNIFTGGKGDDTGILMGRENMMFGGDGNDIAVIAGRINNVFMGAGDDQSFVFGEDGVIDTGAGRDYVVTSGNFNRIDTGKDQDYSVIIGNNNQIELGENNDFANIFGNYNRINGGSGDDAVKLMGYHAVIRSEEGNDILTASSGSKFSQFDGGLGSDLVIMGGYQNTFSGGHGKDSFMINNTIIDCQVKDISSEDNIVFNNIDWNNLWFKRSGYDLKLSILRDPKAKNDQDKFESVGSVTFTDYFNSNQAELIISMGPKNNVGEREYTSLSENAVNILVQAMSSFAPQSGDNGFISSLDSRTRAIIGIAWSDITKNKGVIA